MNSNEENEESSFVPESEEYPLSFSGSPEIQLSECTEFQVSNIYQPTNTPDDSTEHTEQSSKFVNVTIEMPEPDTCDEPTLLTPKKGKIMPISLETPLRPQVTVTIGGKNAHNICFSDTDFSKGWLSCTNPIAIESVVALDASDPQWITLAKNINEIITKSLGERAIERDFLSILILTIHARCTEEKAISLLKYTKEDSKLECRHYATFALPIVYHILKTNNYFSGTIQQLAGGCIDSAYQKSKGHVWNIVTLKALDNSNARESVWFVDVTNKLFAKFSDINLLEELEILQLVEIEDTWKLETKPFENDSFYPYFAVTHNRLKKPSENVEQTRKRRRAATKLFFSNSGDCQQTPQKIQTKKYR